MTKSEILSKVKKLNLPKDSYVVFGSGPMAALGLRESNDIDLLVSKEIYQKLKGLGWQQIEKGPNDNPLTYDVFEVHDNWDFSAYSPTLSDLLSNAFEIDGIKFASIKDVQRWKSHLSRPKDLKDIKLIEHYLNAESI
jgi:hypothetical protein